MNPSLSSFLTQLGFKVVRELSLSSNVVLCKEWCKEEATGRLLVAKRWTPDLAANSVREARALEALGPKELAPNLSVLLQDGDARVLIRTFIQGRALVEFGKDSKLAPSLEQRERLIAELAGQVTQIHHAGWFHRDLTPANIIVGSLGSSKPLTIMDWDLAERADDQNTDSYFSRGTPGFSLGHEHEDLVEQDWLAVEAIAKFLDVRFDRAKLAVNKHKGAPSWWDRIFSDRH